MKNIPSFEQFILMESASGERICIFPGRFQPFHLGHIAALERTAKAFKCKVVPVQILSKTEKSPFPDALLTKIGNAVAKEYSSFMAKYILYPKNLKTVVPQYVKLLQDEGYNPIGIGCGSDRQKDYERQVAYLTSPKSDVPVEEFSVAMVDERAEGGPSGTKVREAIIAGDKAAFEKLTPKSVHPFYNELKKHLS